MKKKILITLLTGLMACELCFAFSGCNKEIDKIGDCKILSYELSEDKTILEVNVELENYTNSKKFFNGEIAYYDEDNYVFVESKQLTVLLEAHKKKEWLIVFDLKENIGNINKFKNFNPDNIIVRFCVALEIYPELLPSSN